MRLGFLKADAVKPEFAERYGEYPDMFARRLRNIDTQINFTTYEVQLRQYPADIDEVDAYLITGSKNSVYDEETWITQLIEFVRELDVRKKPLIGICFGHQLVAHALGGKAAKASQGWQVGIKHNALNSTAKNIGIDAEHFMLLSSHQDQVIELAPKSEILASHPQCPIAMTRLGDHIITVQGHPEFDTSFAHDIFDMRREILGNTRYAEAIESLRHQADNEQVLRWCIDFVRRATMQKAVQQ